MNVNLEIQQHRRMLRKYPRPDILRAFEAYDDGDGPIGISMDTFGGRYSPIQVQAMLRAGKTESDAAIAVLDALLP